MENISRGPIFGDFVTILTEGLMQDNTIARQQSTGVYTDSLLPPVLNVMYCVKVSLRTVKYSLRKTKEKGVMGNLYMSLASIGNLRH